MNDINQQIKSFCIQAKKAAHDLNKLDEKKIITALHAISDALNKHKKNILEANQKDLQKAQENKLSAALIDRLTLNNHRIDAMSSSVKKIAALACPLNKTLASWTVDSGLNISRVSVPIGVIAVIYESRPNVTVDACALCLKSGNAVILRGGSDCVATNHAIMHAIQQGVAQTNIPASFAQLVPTQDRSAINVLLAQHETIDVVIPRGGKNLIQNIMKNSSIPIFKHLDGICHTYVHHSANIDMARDVILNAKMRRPGICGATETVLIDQTIIHSAGTIIVAALLDAGCDIYADEPISKLDSRIKLASEEDWQTEYLSEKISIKQVSNIDAAIEHINHYGSHHTDAIICEDKSAQKLFEKSIDSAIVMHNCSTQFADGGEFGMGAEMGIATGKLHARGPVGVEQLTTFKYIVDGTGQVRPAN